MLRCAPAFARMCIFPSIQLPLTFPPEGLLLRREFGICSRAAAALFVLLLAWDGSASRPTAIDIFSHSFQDATRNRSEYLRRSHLSRREKKTGNLVGLHLDLAMRKLQAAALRACENSCPSRACRSMFAVAQRAAQREHTTPESAEEIDWTETPCR